MDSRGLPPEMSNFYCLPGRAGGSPILLEGTKYVLCTIDFPIRHAKERHLRRRGASFGMHLVAYLNDGISDTETESAAMRAGIVVRATSRFCRSVFPRPA
jgi:hypothetical protein